MNIFKMEGLKNKIISIRKPTFYGLPRICKVCGSKILKPTKFQKLCNECLEGSRKHASKDYKRFNIKTNERRNNR